MNADHNAPTAPQTGAAATAPACLLVAGGLHGSKWRSSEDGAEPRLGDVRGRLVGVLRNLLRSAPPTYGAHVR